MTVTLLLCLALVVGYSYKKPVEVHATGVGAVVGYVVISVCAAALGITIGNSVSNGELKEAYNSIWEKGQDLWNDGCYGLEQIYNVTPSFLKYVGNAIISSGNMDDYNLRAQLPDQKLDYLNPKMGYDFIQSMFGLQTFVNNAPIGFDYFANATTDAVTINGLYILGVFEPTGEVQNLTMRFGTNVKLQKMVGSGGNFSCEATINGSTDFIRFPNWTRYPAENIAGPLGHKCILAVSQVGDVKKYTVISPSEYKDEVSFTYAFDGTTYPAIGDQSYLLDESKIIHDGKSVGVGENTPESVVEALKEKVGVTADDGTVTIPLINTGSKTDIDVDNRTQTQEKTVGAEVATEADKAASEAANEGHDTSTPKPGALPDIKVPSAITKKFPFSLPWDFARVLGAFYPTERKAPYFEIPIVNERLGIHEKIVIDLSQFDGLAEIARWFEFLGYALALILLTRKLANVGGGD